MNLKKFSLVAGNPTTDQALQHCCQAFNGDLVCFNVDNGNIPFSRKYYRLAVERKMFFELCYAPVITDSNHRRNIIRRSHAYHSYGKSKNIIISSAAEKPIDLRTPYEVANLGLLLGLSEEQAKCAMAGNCKKALVRATGRRHNKAVLTVEVETKAEISDDDGDDDTSDDGMDMDEGDEEQPTKKKKML